LKENMNNKLYTIIDSYLDLLTVITSTYCISDYDIIINELTNINIPETLSSYSENYTELKKCIDKMLKVNLSGFLNKQETLQHSEKFEIVDKIKALGNELKRDTESIIGELNEKYVNLYIPILRGLRPVTEKDCYYDRTLKDYFNDEIQYSKEMRVFTGYEMYSRIKALRLSKFEERKRLDQFELFLSEEFFMDKKVTLTADRDSDVLLIKIGNEKEQPIYNLGDGIQSIILITFPLFFYKFNKLKVFIEEPELNLHPGLQRKLLEVLYSNKYFGHCQFFISTHSNHFLDLTLDFSKVSIYTVKKQFEKDSNDFFNLEEKPKFLIENISNEDNTVLEMLGVRNSSVFLSNCTIWVEGITDRYYIRHYLFLYQSHLKIPEAQKLFEDIHYSFVEYSGNNIVHWSFLDEEEVTKKTINVERLCGRLFLITDKDGESKLPRQKKLQTKLGNRYYCLKSREIENLISKEVLKNVLADYEGVSVSELCLKDFEEADYQDEHIGSFLQNIFYNAPNRRGSYQSKSGAVSNKIDFCERTIGKIYNFEDLSTEAKELTILIYEFIQKMNATKFTEVVIN
ncbi:AAA family ATPase, partial [Paenibacillus odorifer]|uniref:AAA family ATPase n=2 Tax=Paenibacillus TaxID=44249 RepID=UPI001C37DB40